MIDWSLGEDFFLALTTVNDFSLTKGGCPTARPHPAPPRSTGDWTRHSKPPFSIFQRGQEPAGFIGVFKRYSLKHSSSVSTRSRAVSLFSLCLTSSSFLAHLLFCAPRTHSASLSISKRISHSVLLIPRAHSSGSVRPSFFF